MPRGYDGIKGRASQGETVRTAPNKNTLHKRGLYTCLALSAALFLSGCGDFHAVPGMNSSDATSSGFGALSGRSTPNTDGRWLSEEGFLNTTSDTPAPQETHYFEGKFKIPFGWVYSATSIAVRLASPFACQLRGVEHESNPLQAYARGEYPCGRIIDGGVKQIINVDVPAFNQTKSQYQVRTDAVQLPIYLGREQYNGTFEQASLDSRATESMTSSKYFGDDISVRYRPSSDGSGMRMELCAVLPGMRITAPRRTVSAHGHERLTFFRIGLDASFDVDLGNAVFDYAKGCFATDINFPDDSFVPQFAFAATEAPHVSNMRFSGFNINIRDWWLRVFDDLLNVFRASFRKAAIKAVVNAQNQFADQELESGHWFEMVHAQDALHAAADTVNRASVRAMRSSGLPLSGTEMRDFLKRQCNLIPIFKEVPANFRELCLEALEDVTVSILPFYNDPEQAASGCYDYFANVHKSTDDSGKWKWWANKCGFTSQIQLRVSAPMDQDGINAIQTALSSLSELDQWLERAIGELRWSPADEALLIYAFQEAISSGEKIRNFGDLISVLPNYRGPAESKIRNWTGFSL